MIIILNKLCKFDMNKALAKNKKRSYLSDTTGSNSEIDTEEEGDKEERDYVVYGNTIVFPYTIYLVPHKK